MEYSPQYLLFLVLVAVVLPSSLATTVLWGNALTAWGKWSKWDDCPGTVRKDQFYGVAVRTKIQSHQGSEDDSALNAIQFGCDVLKGPEEKSFNNVITAGQGSWGDWSEWVHCPSGFNGFRIKSEASIGGGTHDDTAAVALKVLCEDDWLLVGIEHGWGDWLEKKTCPGNEVICGLQTRIEPSQGEGLSDADDTALNDVNIECCAAF